MLYDGDQKILVLIQITINKDHEIHYKELINFINKEEKKKRKKKNKGQKNKGKKIEEEEKKNEEKIAGKKKKEERMNKYQKFFWNLDNGLLNSFVFQWMTREKFPEIKKKTKKDLYELKDNRTFKIYWYHEELEQKLRYGHVIKAKFNNLKKKIIEKRLNDSENLR